jgi:hypothetical protein
LRSPTGVSTKDSPKGQTPAKTQTYYFLIAKEKELARTLGAIGSHPVHVAVTLVFVLTLAMAATRVGALSSSKRQETQRNQKTKHMSSALPRKKEETKTGGEK